METDLLLAFNIDRLRCAISLSSVQQVTRSVAVVPLPTAPDVVLGVVNVRGNVTPVMYVKKRFGVSSDKQISVDEQLIIANTRKRSAALVVDSVIGIIKKSSAPVIDPNAIVPGIEHVQGITTLAGDIVYIHDLDSFLSLDEERRLQDAMELAEAMP